MYRANRKPLPKLASGRYHSGSSPPPCAMEGLVLMPDQPSAERCGSAQRHLTAAASPGLP